MSKKILSGILGGFLGLICGLIGGGYLGLVVGGTVLGGFEIYENIGIEGYELAAYVGAIIGGIIMMLIGIKSHLELQIKRPSNDKQVFKHLIYLYKNYVL